MEILNKEIETRIQNDIIDVVLRGKCDLARGTLVQVIDELYVNIPDNKRISYGIVHVIKTLSEYLYTHLVEEDAPVYRIASHIFDESDDSKSKGVSLGILSFYGLSDYKKAFPCFESAAASSDWKMRELAQMFFRKLIVKHPDQMKEYLLRLVKSEDANIRRFVAETLWIAYRACRNLVKKEPVKVMDLLKVDEYKYKKRIYTRSGYPGNRS